MKRVLWLGVSVRYHTWLWLIFIAFSKWHNVWWTWFCHWICSPICFLFYDRKDKNEFENFFLLMNFSYSLCTFDSFSSKHWCFQEPYFVTPWLLHLWNTYPQLCSRVYPEWLLSMIGNICLFYNGNLFFQHLLWMKFFYMIFACNFSSECFHFTFVNTYDVYKCWISFPATRTGNASAEKARELICKMEVQKVFFLVCIIKLLFLWKHPDFFKISLLILDLSI